MTPNRLTKTVMCPEYGTVGINGLSTMFAYDADLPGEYGTVGINGYKAQCLLTMQTCPENKYGTVGINGLSTMLTYDVDCP